MRDRSVHSPFFLNFFYSSFFYKYLALIKLRDAPIDRLVTGIGTVSRVGKCRISDPVLVKYTYILQRMMIHVMHTAAQTVTDYCHSLTH